MSDTQTSSLGSRLRGGASWLFAKLHAIPPLLTLPAVGLAAWFATPYAVRLAEGRSVSGTNSAEADGADGTTTVPRADPAAHQPASGTPSSGGTAASGIATILNRPVTAATIPSWLPLPVPVPTPALRPAPQPRVVAQSPAILPPRPKATARLVEPMPQQRFAERQVPQHRVEQHRPIGGPMPSPRNNITTGRSAAVGNGFPQIHPGGPGTRGTFSVQPGFRGPGAFGPSFGNSMRSGGAFRGGHR